MGSTTSTDYHGQPKTSHLAVASLVCGIIGLLFLGVFIGPLAIIFGAVAMNRINEKPLELEGRGIAKAGIICGIVAIVVSIIVIILLTGG